MSSFTPSRIVIRAPNWLGDLVMALPAMAMARRAFPEAELTIAVPPAFAPIFEQAAEGHPDVVFGKINSDEQQELAGAFGIRSIPTLMVFRDKVVLFQQAGALPASALEQVLAQAKALDMAKVHQEIASREQQGATAQS